MKRILNRLSFLIMISLAALVAGGCNFAPGKGEAAAEAGGPPLEVMGFYDGEGVQPLPNVFDMLQSNRRGLDSLSPFWYEIKSDGSVVDRVEDRLAGFSRDNGIPLEPVFRAAGDLSGFLGNPAVAVRVVKNIGAEVERRRYAGIVIDFPLGDALIRDPLSAFLDMLARELHSRSKRLVLMVRLSEVDNLAAGALDTGKLIGVADRVVLVAVDRYGPETQPGPIAPLEWVERSTQRALQVIGSPDRVLLALADYGYDWPGGGGLEGDKPIGPLNQSEIKTLGAEEAARILRDRDGSPHFSYTVGAGQRRVWFEDEVSATAKLQLARDLGLVGVAIWKIGLEDQVFWDVIRRYR